MPNFALELVQEARSERHLIEVRSLGNSSPFCPAAGSRGEARSRSLVRRRMVLGVFAPKVRLVYSLVIMPFLLTFCSNWNVLHQSRSVPINAYLNLRPGLWG